SSRRRHTISYGNWSSDVCSSDLMSEETYDIVAAAPALPGVRVAILGTGKMGGILLQAFLKNNLLSQEQLFATVHHAERAQALSRSEERRVGKGCRLRVCGESRRR